MRAQPPLLGGAVGNLSEIQHRLPLLGPTLGLDDPSLEEKKFTCIHCGNGMTRDYLVWHMNAKYVAPLSEV